ncbi:MAG: SpoVR family protein [Smithella sp.]
MELIDQHTKRIMEGCKERARDAGLIFQDQTLEYIVTNKDILELGPKSMIPTMYDYWVNDVEVLKEKGKYELYPENPYETVINTRPAISFYNDNNPDWLNVMIFYHVLAHIDFFQNNLAFRHTWDEDFSAQALSDKRTIAQLRAEKGRWLDYVIEFSRSIDNLVDFFRILSNLNRPAQIQASRKIDYYFDIFLQKVEKVSISDYLKEINRYNEIIAHYGSAAESVFFSEIIHKYPEFDAMLEKYNRKPETDSPDLIRFLQVHSPFLNKSENEWMKVVMGIVRRTSLYFQPQIRTKILNEGWASYWHDRLFMNDDRIRGNEVSYARINAKVTALSRLGINPYALGMRLLSYLEEIADRGRLCYDFQRIMDYRNRQQYDCKTQGGLNFLFDVRKNCTDFTFINTFVEQDFVDRYRLFVVGQRLNAEKGVMEYYVKSRKAADFKQMLIDSLYHPPHITVCNEKMKDGILYLDHKFEGKPLVQEYIANTMLGIEYLWGKKVLLETSEMVTEKTPTVDPMQQFPYYPPAKADIQEKEPAFKRVLYTMENKKLSKTFL